MGVVHASVDFTRSTDNITVRQGDTAIIRCYVEDTNSKVAWLNRSGIIFAGQDKWSQDPRVVLERQTPPEYSLRIQKVDTLDEGPYTCSVQTQRHPKTSQVHLIMQVPPKSTNISSDITVNEGSNVTLVCMANGCPEPLLTWRHLTPKVREFEGEEEYLDILGITREQSGKYGCKAGNKVASDDVKQGHCELSPNHHGVQRLRGLHGQACLPALRGFSGAHTSICVVQRIKSAQGLEIRNIRSCSILLVSNVTEEQYGNYTCVATNKLDFTNTSLFLYRPGTAMLNNGSLDLAAPFWLLAASHFCLFYKC
ncbi:hypothetical protein NDU88_001080 [Pleurodeles waltl]|uniref:Ig-like domain-containing protein n=1 Tax=Pleurodeles waltl TaxID=8319 RepID=A0AAV7WLL1_PLEWA|nr:hypothetical protein NDU88_001080 [Pleurodeles waltl]